jgi:hypothetical protein
MSATQISVKAKRREQTSLDYYLRSFKAGSFNVAMD